MIMNMAIAGIGSAMSIAGGAIDGARKVMDLFKGGTEARMPRREVMPATRH